MDLNDSREQPAENTESLQDGWVTAGTKSGATAVRRRDADDENKTGFHPEEGWDHS